MEYYMWPITPTSLRMYHSLTVCSATGFFSATVLRLEMGDTQSWGNQVITCCLWNRDWCKQCFHIVLCQLKFNSMTPVAPSLWPHPPTYEPSLPSETEEKLFLWFIRSCKTNPMFCCMCLINLQRALKLFKILTDNPTGFQISAFSKERVIESEMKGDFKSWSWHLAPDRSFFFSLCVAFPGVWTIMTAQQGGVITASDSPGH